MIRQFQGELKVSNLPSKCPSERTSTVSYDFDRFGQSNIRVYILDTPDCANANDYCKGYFGADLGPPAK